MYDVLFREIQHSLSSDIRVDVQQLSRACTLEKWERAADQLHLQPRVYRAGWCRMCGMYPGDVQRSERIVAVLTMLSGEVFDRDRRDTGVDVQPVSDIRLLTRR